MSATRTRRISWPRATAAAAVLALALAGCGGDDDTSADGAPQEQADTPEEPEAPGPDDADAESGLADGDGSAHEDGEDGGDGGDGEDGGDDAPADQGWDGASEPAFLEAHEIPNPYDNPWSVTGTSQGLPPEERFCTEGVLPAESTWHRSFGKETSGAAYQVVVHAGDPSAAAELMDELTTAIANCPDTQNVGRGTTEFEDHGERDAGDAARSFAKVFTPDAPGGIATDGVGVARSGSTVLYVLASDGSELGDFPPGTFDAPLNTALERIGG